MIDSPTPIPLDPRPDSAFKPGLAVTVMRWSNLGYRIRAMAVYVCLTSLDGVSRMKFRRDLNIAQKSAWHLAHRLRKALESNGGMFSAPVEVDETYMGGKRANMSNAVRFAPRAH